MQQSMEQSIQQGMTQDEHYMSLAIKEAKKGIGKVNPNPLVGAIIVKNDKVISKGHHAVYGGFHAERNAILSCKESMEGATIYVTLEPCCHYGKTPPCTQIIIEHNFAKVVIGSIDPNPLVARQGIEILKEHQIQVVEGVLEKECIHLNQVFFHYIQTKTPYVVMKYAMTLDGKIATKTGKSKWISGETSRKNVHELRNRLAAIMVGIETVCIDNPSLDCRIENGNHPIRIICDTNLRLPNESIVVQTAKQVPTWIATCSTDQEKRAYFLEAGCKILDIHQKDGRIDLKHLMKVLGEHQVDSILLEGGATLHEAALRQQIVQAIQVYIAPKIFGGQLGKTPVAGLGIEDVEQAYQIVNLSSKQVGEDILIEGEVEYNVHRDC